MPGPEDLRAAASAWDDERQAAARDRDTAAQAIASRDAVIADLTQQLLDCRNPGPPPEVPDKVLEPSMSLAALNAAIASAGEGGLIEWTEGTYQAGVLRALSGQRHVAAGPVLIDFGLRVDFGFPMRENILDVTFEGIDMANARKAAIQACHGLTVKGGNYYGCGWNGIRGNFESRPARVLIEDVEADGNGWDPAALGHAAGGLKFFESGGAELGQGVTMRRVHAHDNIGNGIWLDHDNGGDLLDECLCERNTRKGVFYEVGKGPVRLIRCELWDNGQPGFQTTNTARGELLACTFGGNGGGVAALFQTVDRIDHGTPFVPGGWLVKDPVPRGDVIRDRTGVPGAVVIEGA